MKTVVAVIWFKLLFLPSVFDLVLWQKAAAD
jgi:hypothetical protein